MILPDKDIGLNLSISDDGAIVVTLQNNVFIFNHPWWTSSVFDTSSLDYNRFYLLAFRNRRW